MFDDTTHFYKIRTIKLRYTTTFKASLRFFFKLNFIYGLLAPLTQARMEKKKDGEGIGQDLP